MKLSIRGQPITQFLRSGAAARFRTVNQAISAGVGVAATGGGPRTGPAPIPPAPPPSATQAAVGATDMAAMRAALQAARGQPSGGIVANLPPDLAARLQPPADAVTEESLQATRDEMAGQMQAVGQAEPLPSKPGVGGPLAAGVAGFLVAGPVGAVVGAGAMWWLGRKKGV